ncbi:MAG: YfcE family phosphodiesterase [Oscillospiraceae bacterium]|nr:YfcE family phosphodiesterase [Oscillospiraceae bacterium]
MKILVFSDTHGDAADMVAVILDRRPDAVFFLGDVLRDLEDVTYGFPELPVYAVPGNCDYALPEPLSTTKLVSLGGVTFMLCHGHTYGVKSGYSSAVSAAERSGADVLLCGHTHVPHFDEYGPLQLLNPGSLRYTHTYGVITVDHGVAHCNLNKIE